ncbi:MAG: cation-transporting P-type ATPase [Rhodospirillales bacterium]
MDLTTPHATAAADCLVNLATTPDGLSATEAVRRLVEHGPNRLPEVRSRGPAVRFFLQFHNVLI